MPLYNANATAAIGQLPGTATNDSAATGKLGEFVSSTIALGSAVSLSTGTPANVTSISLTAGDWDVWADFRLTGNAATTLSDSRGSISTTSATLDTTSAGRMGTEVTSGTIFGTDNIGFTVGATRVSLAATTTVYLVAQATFGVNTCAAYGSIMARRVR